MQLELIMDWGASSGLRLDRIYIVCQLVGGLLIPKMH